MRIHLIGIGGVGMAGLAVLLKTRGHAVSGCDIHATPRTRWLEAQGIPVAIGHSPAHLADVDEVVITPAVRPEEPERVAAGEKGVRVRFRGEVLAEIANGCETIAVCGSHGKTTTATWIARLLLALGEKVSWCIGGETGDFPVAGAECGLNAREPESLSVQKGQSTSNAQTLKLSNSQTLKRSNSQTLVVEADESDGTLALYRARTLVVNKCEYDHPDHFKTEADYFACYETAKKNAEDVVESERLGRLDGLECLENLAAHNRKNARAAIEVALRRGHRLEDIAQALPAVVSTLPDRRFQVVWPPPGQSNGSAAVVADYAHHPTEMRCAVDMARAKCTGTLRVLFQPHRYSRTKALLRDFPAAFGNADEVVLCPTYAAFEEPVEGGDIADLYRACREARRGDAGLHLARSCEEAWEHARNSMADGDLTLLLGAGDIINLVPRVIADLSPHPASPVPRPLTRIWIGAGSNTWKSDLNLGVEYVKTTGPAGAPGASLGIPWMAGIPGTIGGWVKMNAGAFGHSISEVVDQVKVDGRWIPAAACGFAYRHSDIRGEIQDVKWNLPSLTSGGNAASPLSAEFYLAKRKKFPAGTYGSFFKNPEGDFAGRLLESAGAKDLRVGGAYVWAEHANVIVRGEEATASDVLALARLMRNRVLFRFGVSLEPEVCGVELS